MRTPCPLTRSVISPFVRNHRTEPSLCSSLCSTSTPADASCKMGADARLDVVEICRMDEPRPGTCEVWKLVIGIAQRRLELGTDIEFARREIRIPHADTSGSRGQGVPLLTFAQRDF